VDAYIRRALVELGLTNPTGVDSVEHLKDRARKVGRALLGKYHPDRNPSDLEALGMFKAVNQVLQNLDKIQVPPPRSQVKVSWSYYPPMSPHGGAATAETRTSSRQGYFNFKVEQKGGVKYDAKRVVFIRPK